MAQAAFPASARLRQSAEFRSVFGNGRKYVSPGLVIIAAPGLSDQPRLGLALAKRRIPRAVDRNRVKRVLRESFRSSRDQLPRVDVVALARSRTARMSNAALFSQLATIWLQIGRISHQPQSPGRRVGSSSQS